MRTNNGDGGFKARNGEWTKSIKCSAVWAYEKQPVICIARQWSEVDETILLSSSLKPFTNSGLCRASINDA